MPVKRKRENEAKPGAASASAKKSPAPSRAAPPPPAKEKGEQKKKNKASPPKTKDTVAAATAKKKSPLKKKTLTDRKNNDKKTSKKATGPVAKIAKGPATQPTPKKSRPSPKIDKDLVSICEEQLQKAKVNLAEAKKAAGDDTKKHRHQEFSVPDGSLAKYELSKNEKQYTGDPDDRKAMLEHRQVVQAKGRALEKEKEKFIASEKQKYDQIVFERREIENGVRRAEKAVEQAAKNVELAKKGKLKATAVLPGLLAGGAKTKEEGPQKSKPRVIIQEDSLLDAPTRLHPPTWLSKEETSLLTASLAIVDALRQVDDVLDVASPSLLTFQRMLRAASSYITNSSSNGGSSDGDGEDDELSNQRELTSSLYALYYTCLCLVLDDAKSQTGSRRVVGERLKRALTLGTWPECLRRLILGRNSIDAVYDRPPKDVVLAATGLQGEGGMDGLSREQHVALLGWLVEEVMSTSVARLEFDSKEGQAEEARRVLLEEKKRLREVKEALQQREEGNGGGGSASAASLMHERSKAEEAVGKAQDRVNTKSEQVALRRVPLGRDRHHRRYWMFGPKISTKIYVEDVGENGKWGFFEDEESLDKLIRSLDARGKRESNLKQTLQRRHAALIAQFKLKKNDGLTSERNQARGGTKRTDWALGSSGGGADGEDGIVRRSERERRQVEFYGMVSSGSARGRHQHDGSTQHQQQDGDENDTGSYYHKNGVKKHSVLETRPVTLTATGLWPKFSEFGVAEAQSFVSIVNVLHALMRKAEKAGVHVSSSLALHMDSGMNWADALCAEMEDGKELHAALKMMVVDFEAMLVAVTGEEDREEEEEGGEEEEEEDVEGEGTEEGGASGGGGGVEGEHGFGFGSLSRNGSASELASAAVGAIGAGSAGTAVDADLSRLIAAATGAAAVMMKLWKAPRERRQWMSEPKNTNAQLAFCVEVLRKRAEPLLTMLHKELKLKKAQRQGQLPPLPSRVSRRRESESVS